MELKQNIELNVHQVTQTQVQINDHVVPQLLDVKISYCLLLSSAYPLTYVNIYNKNLHYCEGLKKSY